MKTLHWVLACVSVSAMVGVSAWVEASSSVSPSMLEAAREVVVQARRESAINTVNTASKQTCSSTASSSVERIHADGPTYPITEPNILEAFMAGIIGMKASGEYDRRFAQSKEEIRDRLQNPPAVEGLIKAEAVKSWPLEVSIPETLPEKLLREAANVPMPRLQRELLFIDGNDEESLMAAEILGKKLPQMRVVLVAGSVSEASRFLGKRVFFDQMGALTKQFGFTATPALVHNGEDGPYVTEFTSQNPEEVLPLIK